jgi:hypothetical protein
MTAPGEGERDDPRTPQQPAWNPPWEPPPTPSAADYPPDYPPPYPPPYPPQFGPPSGGYAPPPPPPPGYYPAPDHPGGWGYPPQAPQTGSNPLAIASLVLSFTGFVCCIGSIAAIVLGVIALDQIKRTRQEGHGLAVAGIVIGGAGLVVALIAGLFALTSR